MRWYKKVFALFFPHFCPESIFLFLFVSVIPRAPCNLDFFSLVILLGFCQFAFCLFSLSKHLALEFLCFFFKSLLFWWSLHICKTGEILDTDVYMFHCEFFEYYFIHCCILLLLTAFFIEIFITILCPVLFYYLWFNGWDFTESAVCEGYLFGGIDSFAVQGLPLLLFRFRLFLSCVDTLSFSLWTASFWHSKPKASNSFCSQLWIPLSLFLH